MPALVIPNSFSPNTVALSSAVNGNFNAVATLLNSTLLDSTNLQDGAVTGAKLDPGVVDNSTLQYTSSQLSIKDLGVTQAKRAALGQQVSSSCGTFSTISGSFVSVTNLTVTITTTGRPVFIGLIPDGTTGFSNISAQSGASGFDYRFRNTSTSTDIARGLLAQSAWPVSAFSTIYVVAAGTYVITFDIASDDGIHTSNVSFAKLIAYEL